MGRTRRRPDAVVFPRRLVTDRHPRAVSHRRGAGRVYLDGHDVVRTAMDVDAFFRDYTEEYNRALAGSPDFDAIRASFTDELLAAGPERVSVGRNDDAFAEQLAKGYAFYRAIGTRRMCFLRAETTPIDGAHLMAKVFYRVEYDAQSIELDLTYLVQTSGPRPRIFAFVAGDEMSLYRKLGLVDAEGRPVERTGP